MKIHHPWPLSCPISQASQGRGWLWINGSLILLTGGSRSLGAYNLSMDIAGLSAHRSHRKYSTVQYIIATCLQSSSS